MGYFLAPSPSLAIGENDYATWNDSCTQEELERIEKLCSKLILGESKINRSDSQDENIRKSQISWIQFNNESSFLYDKLAWIIRQVNGQFFDFELSGFFEDIQYTVYNSENSHYDWHVDRGKSGFPPRKLSLVLQLSDPSEYEGGELLIKTGAKDKVITKQKGHITIFPSFVLHKVTPVTKGIRKTLVAWVSGPRFR